MPCVRFRLAQHAMQNISRKGMIIMQKNAFSIQQLLYFFFKKCNRKCLQKIAPGVAKPSQEAGQAESQPGRQSGWLPSAARPHLPPAPAWAVPSVCVETSRFLNLQISRSPRLQISTIISFNTIISFTRLLASHDY